VAKSQTKFVCRDCGAVQPRWMGKCPDCGAWDALEEFRVQKGGSSESAGVSAALDGTAASKAAPLTEVQANADNAQNRLATGIGEFDRVLGGTAPHTGVVPGSAVLVGGDPGIGKSTLLLQAAAGLAKQNRRVLYVTTEESAAQLRMRADRLFQVDESADKLLVLSETQLPRVMEQLRQHKPDVAIIDSVQMLHTPDVSAAPGSVTQLRACCQQLVILGKSTGCATMLVGHVTKQGTLAGPRLLEHLVDAVLYFEGDRYHQHRVVRAVKNRFGTTMEVGLFEMSDKGLTEASDSGTLVADLFEARPGSVVCPALQGTRTLLVEVQALTATGFLGSAKRKASGIDANRLAMLIAVLEKHGGQRLADQDIFAASVGGMKIVEPASDLALLLAIAGAHTGKTLPPKTAVFGEVGLSGEVRPVNQAEARLHEAQRMGFTSVILAPGTRGVPKNQKTHDAATVARALEHLT